MDEFPSVKVEGCCHSVRRNVAIDIDSLLLRTRSAGVFSARYLVIRVI